MLLKKMSSLYIYDHKSINNKYYSVEMMIIYGGFVEIKFFMDGRYHGKQIEENEISFQIKDYLQGLCSKNGYYLNDRIRHY